MKPVPVTFTYHDLRVSEYSVTAAVTIGTVAVKTKPSHMAASHLASSDVFKNTLAFVCCPSFYATDESILHLISVADEDSKKHFALPIPSI